MLKTKNLDKKILNTFIFIFIFNMINREFKLLIDLRYLNLCVAGYLIVKAMYKKGIGGISKEINNCKKQFWSIVIFYLFIVLSNISWIWNGVNVDIATFMSLTILNLYNFLSIIVFFIYYNEINTKNIVKNIVFAGFILSISMILTALKIDIYFFASEKARVYSKGVSIIGDFRIAGYAEDPNYASFSMIIMAYIGLKYVDIKKNRYLILLIAIIGYLLSFSKTLLAGVVLISIYKLVLKREYLKGYQKGIEMFIGGIIMMAPIIVGFFKLNIFKSSTMSQRVDMWSSAMNLFSENPIIGGGLSSSRSFYEMSGRWYVQTHSTFIQVISEHGIIAFCIFSLIIIKMLVEKQSDFIFLIFLFLGITTELIYLPFWPFLFLYYLVFKNKGVNKHEENFICNKLT
ncbi:O-antigen ligase [uncultured Clostridium sp.]|uniref:O-antigen ligase family protein n=1 Tax=uncultured Clostridium sp. TaxID=59620 RepID=UPI00261528EA|nr:O-antigen ligase family protein [uncultured Clostridium sp.]